MTFQSTSQSTPQMIRLVLTIILDLAGHLRDNETAQRIIDLLERWLPTILNEARDLLPAMQGIIDTLRGSNVLTCEQDAAINNLNMQSDSAFEAAAAAALKGA
jgi:hypothetical protein